MKTQYQLRVSDAETVKMLDITKQVQEIADQPRNDLSDDVIAECLLEDAREAAPDFDIQLIRRDDADEWADHATRYAQSLFDAREAADNWFAEKRQGA